MKKKSFGLLKLEMADLDRFWRKTPLGPLEVKCEVFDFFQEILQGIQC
jgi:hypothetical protein